jgi:hypothetical protein
MRAVPFRTPTLQGCYAYLVCSQCAPTPFFNCACLFPSLPPTPPPPLCACSSYPPPLQQATASNARSELEVARRQLQQEQQRHVQLQEQLEDVQEAAVQVWCVGSMLQAFILVVFVFSCVQSRHSPLKKHKKVG